MLALSQRNLLKENSKGLVVKMIILQTTIKMLYFMLISLLEYPMMAADVDRVRIISF